MRHRADEDRNHFQTMQRAAMRVSSGITGVATAKGGRFALCALLGMFGVAPAVFGQAAPQTIPYYHTIAAGSGVTYTPVTVTGGAGIHGSAPGDGGPATASAVELNGPDALATDSLGNLYIVDTAGTIRKVDTNGNISTFAGGMSLGKSSAPTCSSGYTDTDGDGCPANEAYFNAAHGLAIDPATGDIYIAEATGDRIRKISHTTYLLSLIAGTGSKGSTNGDLDTCATTSGATCSGTIGTVSGPRGMAVDKHSNLYIADTTNSAVRLANFTTGQLTTVVNLAFTKATTATCTTNATATTAGAANTGAIDDVAFDNADNMYVADSTCNVIYKVAEDSATGMVDSGSAISVVLGTGLSSPAQSVFTNVLGTSVTLTPSSVRADPLGNLYIGESTGSHVWYWDAATKYMHTVFGGSATTGNCYGVAGSGTAPYNGCDGPDSSPSTVKGTPGLALDAWGNLYIADTAGFYVHKLALGTNAPAATVPAGYGNMLLHFGAGDGFGSVSMTAAPDFGMAVQTCTINNSADNTQDCPFIVTNTHTSASAQYEQAVVTSTLGKSVTVALTNQTYPVCQAPTAASKTVFVSGATAVTLASQPGDACTGAEIVVDSPNKYTYAVTKSPANGTLSGTAPALTYTPNNGFTGDSFLYTATDTSTFAGAVVTYDSGASSITLEAASPTVSTAGTITLAVYTAPVATAQSVTVAYNTATAITLSGTDVNGATLTYAIVTGPAHGTLTGTAPALTYTPTANYFGSDSFTFTVNDGVKTSTAATVSITVNPAAPVATNQNVSVNYQTATGITLTATGNGTLTYAIKTQPAHGTLGTLSGAGVTYTPANGYSGADSFMFTVTNAGGSSTGLISITVGAAPVVPVAQPSSVTVVFNTATQITAVAGGGNGHALTYSVVTGPAHGTLGAFSGANITYTPGSTYSGADSFTFDVSDGTSTSNVATISITVTLPPPVAGNQSVTAAFQTALPITLTATGSGTLTYSIVTTPTHGTLSGTAPTVTYTPNVNYVGSDSFTFQANNGAASNVATVLINVSAPPVPVPANQSVTTAYQTAKAITLSATGSGTITYAVATQPAHGTLSGTAPNETYTPTAGYYGPDSFTFTATNPGGPATGTISITVAPPPPVANPQSVTVPYAVTSPITLVATGGGTITYAVVTGPAHGTYTLSGAVVSYTPNSGYYGADSFTFQGNNGSPSNTATVSITVNPPAPTATSFSVNVVFDTATAVTLSATGVGTITYQVVTNPANGTLSGSGSKLTYTPNSGFAGSDSFTYTASNVAGPGNVATVSITVSAGFMWLVAPGSSASATVAPGGTATYNLLLSGYTGASGPVAFGCSGAAVLCTMTPNPGTLSGTAQIPVTVTMVTSVSPPSTAGIGTLLKGRWGWCGLLGLAGCLLLLPVRKRKPMLLGAIALVATVGLSGCGTVPYYPFGTTPGTYTLYVLAIQGSTVPIPLPSPVPTNAIETLTLIVN